jgi:predicted secreted hydrolase
VAVALSVIVAACSGPILARPAAERPTVPSTPSPTAEAADPRPIVLPADDGAHRRLTEWWYYTGHLDDEQGGRYGFELVVFRAERGAFPVSWASHLAITDETTGTFRYAQRSQVGPSVDVTDALGDGAAFGFRIGESPGWEVSRIDRTDQLRAALARAEWAAAGATGPLAIELRATTDRPAALHDVDGWIDFGPAGGSYYYSRTRAEAGGTLTIDGVARSVRGTVWFDHQWGDFIAVGGGWDWFAIGLDDGSDVAISRVRDLDGKERLAYGTLIAPDGSTRHVPGSALVIGETRRWTSPATGATYPSGWSIALPGEDLSIELQPTVADQELDTRATTGVVYWEGSTTVSAVRSGRPLGGRAYVELTGYLDAGG